MKIVLALMYLSVLLNVTRAMFEEQLFQLTDKFRNAKNYYVSYNDFIIVVIIIFIVLNIVTIVIIWELKGARSRNFRVFRGNL